MSKVKQKVEKKNEHRVSHKSSGNFTLFTKSFLLGNAAMFFMSNARSIKQIVLQGDPNQNCPFLRAITLKVCFSDPMLVKSNCV